MEVTGRKSARGLYWSQPLQEPQSCASLSPTHTLNARSLHSIDHRFAMICSGRDDRVGGS